DAFRANIPDEGSIPSASTKKIKLTKSNIGRKGARIFLKSFHVAGFGYYEGAFLFDEMSIGSKIEMALDTNNVHDEHAIDLKFKGRKIGYVPRDKNHEIAKIFGRTHNF
ncbi:hypothetical protein H8D59_00815, partial [bacterium]|nr:hypothetical protein [bacterium]